MADPVPGVQASPNPTPHPVFSDLLNLLQAIRYQVCNRRTNPQYSKSSDPADRDPRGDNGDCSKPPDDEPAKQKTSSSLDGDGSEPAKGTITASTGTSTTSPCLICDECKYNIQLDKLKMDINYINQSLEKLSTFEQNLAKHKEALEGRVRVCSTLPKQSLAELTAAVLKLKFQLPSTSCYEFQSHTHACTSTANVEPELEKTYRGLNPNEKKCLWYFSIFDGEVKKRLLINWWIGEDLLPVSTGPDGKRLTWEEEGEKMLLKLESDKFIQQTVRKNRRVARWTMEPSARSFLKLQPKLLDREALLLEPDYNPNIILPNQVKAVLNIHSSSIGGTEAEMLAHMGNLRVVHLGRSQMTDPRRVVRIENPKLIMKRVSAMKQVRLLSLQGSPSITQLPASYSPPTTLRVLNLSECQALESLPSWVRKLTNLVHLDVSGCLILGWMPKVISLLHQLEVLKGFVVGPRYGQINSCTLQDLQKLKKLHKLSIRVSTNRFPQDQDLMHLARIESLVKLKIRWTPAPKQDPVQNSAQVAKPHFTCCVWNQPEPETYTVVFQSLKKLDLCYAPREAAPVLLDPPKFPNLKQLCIEGAKFGRLDIQHEWKVETLRLRFLTDFEMNQEELQFFPDLSNLDMQDCKKLDELSQYWGEEGVRKVQ